MSESPTNDEIALNVARRRTSVTNNQISDANESNIRSSLSSSDSSFISDIKYWAKHPYVKYALWSFIILSLIATGVGLYFKFRPTTKDDLQTISTSTVSLASPFQTGNSFVSTFTLAPGSSITYTMNNANSGVSYSLTLSYNSFTGSVIVDVLVNGNSIVQNSALSSGTTTDSVLASGFALNDGKNTIQFIVDPNSSSSLTITTLQILRTSKISSTSTSSSSSISPTSSTRVSTSTTAATTHTSISTHTATTTSAPSSVSTRTRSTSTTVASTTTTGSSTTPSTSPLTTGNTNGLTAAHMIGPLPGPTGPEKVWNNVYITFYGFDDNDNGAGTYGVNTISNPTIHATATQDLGTYDHPSTWAGDTQFRQVPAGTIIYVPKLRKYFIQEDTCVECAADAKNGKVRMDMYIGDDLLQGAPLINCENSMTGSPYTDIVITNPKSTYPVFITPIFHNKVCTTTTFPTTGF